jgi:pimeloyl-ACP methyl ester carboxylesterase
MSLADTGLHHSEAGQGDSLVLLDWTPWQTSVLADALAEKYRVLSIEPPAGGSGSGGTAQDVAAQAATVAEAAGLESYTLVGASLGADVALNVALVRPASVAALVLASPTCVEPGAALSWSTPELAMQAMLAHPEDAAQTPPDAGRTAVLAALAERWKAGYGDIANLLSGLSCAALVVLGQEDRLVSRRAGGVWKERVPNCSVCYVYDAGHAIHVDRPDALINVALDFAERRETYIVENRSSLINP